MSEGCNHDCGNCTQNCPSRQMKPEDFLESPHEMSSIRKVIDLHHRHGAEGIGKVFEQRRAGGGAQLALDAAAVDGHLPQDIGSGRGGHWQDAVGALNLAAAHMDGGCHHTVGGDRSGG